MSPQLLRAVRSLRRALHANRAWFNACAEYAEADAMFDHGEFCGGCAAEEQMWQRRCAIAYQIADRFGIARQELDHAVAASEWHEHECMLEAMRARERARAQEPDPIRDAIDRACVELVAMLCPTCRTELAFPGDVCGFCRPGELPSLN